MYRISELAEHYMKHDMIRSHTDLPEFPENQSKLLFYFLQYSDCLDHKELYTLVTSLLQVGLDTHELVDNDELTTSSRKQTLARQLKILAGDYFSGRFYELLAKTGQIEVIRRLSNAICDVNRVKMNLYMKIKQFKLTAEEYLNLSTQIRTKLYASFTNMMDERYVRIWPEILVLLTRCELIQDELIRSSSLSQSRDRWAFWHVYALENTENQVQLQKNEIDDARWMQYCDRHQVKKTLYHALQKAFDQLQIYMHEIDSTKLLRELKKMIEPYSTYLRSSHLTEEI